MHKINQQLQAVDTHELMMPEFVAAPYTGPLFVKYNAVLRGRKAQLPAYGRALPGSLSWQQVHDVAALHQLIGGQAEQAAKAGVHVYAASRTAAPARVLEAHQMVCAAGWRVASCRRRSNVSRPYVCYGCGRCS